MKATASPDEPHYALHPHERLREAARLALAEEGWDPWELPMVLCGLREELGLSRAELDAVLTGISDER